MIPGLTIPAIAHRQINITDFSDYALGIQLDAADWTLRRSGSVTNFPIQTGGRVSDRMVVLDNSDTNYSLLTWDQVPSAVADFEVLASCNFDSMPDVDGGSGICGRVDTDGSDGYNATFKDTGFDPDLEIARFAGTVWQESLDLDDQSELNTTDWFWLRWQVEGTTFRAKFWEYGTAEPASWEAVGSDGTISSGRIGLMTRAFQMKWSWFAVVQGAGKTAPFPQG